MPDTELGYKNDSTPTDHHLSSTVLGILHLTAPLPANLGILHLTQPEAIWEFALAQALAQAGNRWQFAWGSLVVGWALVEIRVSVC